jgi:hypothetical protein
VEKVIGNPGVKLPKPSSANYMILQSTVPAIQKRYPNGARASRMKRDSGRAI